MTNILYEAYTCFEHLYVIYKDGTFVVRSVTNTNDPDVRPYSVFTGHLEDCINFVKEEEIKDLERRF